MTESELIEKLLNLKEKISQLQKDNSSLREKNYQLEAELNTYKSKKQLAKPITIGNNEDKLLTIKKHDLGDVDSALSSIRQNKITKNYRIGSLTERDKIRYTSFIKHLYKDAKIENNKFILNDLNTVKNELLMTPDELSEMFNKLLSMNYNNIPLFEIKDDILTSIIKPDTMINYILEEFNE